MLPRAAGRLCRIVAAALLLGAGAAWSQEETTLRSDEEQALTGEVVAVSCYLRDGNAGIGRLNAEHQQVCILRGSPIAIKVGNRLYALAPETERSPVKQRLAVLVGHQVTVLGRVTGQDGRLRLAISHVERTD